MIKMMRLRKKLMIKKMIVKSLLILLMIQMRIMNIRMKVLTMKSNQRKVRKLVKEMTNGGITSIYMILKR